MLPKKRNPWSFLETLPHPLKGIWPCNFHSVLCISGMLLVAFVQYVEWSLLDCLSQSLHPISTSTTATQRQSFCSYQVFSRKWKMIKGKVLKSIKCFKNQRKIKNHRRILWIGVDAPSILKLFRISEKRTNILGNMAKMGEIMLTARKISPWYPGKTIYFWKEANLFFPKIYSFPWVLTHSV